LKDRHEVHEHDKNVRKINFYKELCVTILAQKHHHITDIESIYTILFTKRLNEKNLKDHKDLISNLLHVLQEKNEEIYLLKSENEILNKELNYWIYGYDKLKHNKELRVTKYINYHRNKKTILIYQK